MDPRFQPQNNPSYPQNPTYNPPPNPTGPNIYPNLPPIHNPQYQPPAQQYPGHYPQNNPYHPSAAHGGYLPLTNYGNGLNQGENVLHAEKMKELEKGLDSCFIKCYRGWLWLSIICWGMAIFRMFMGLATTANIVGLATTTNLSNVPGLFIAGFFYGIWGIIQSIFGIQAISQKSLAKANVACVMMFIYIIPTIFESINFSIAIANHVPDPNDDTPGLWYGVMYVFLFGFILNTLLGIFVNLFGALKVRKILKERNSLQERFERSEDSIQA